VVVVLQPQEFCEGVKDMAGRRRRFQAVPAASNGGGWGRTGIHSLWSDASVTASTGVAISGDRAASGSQSELLVQDLRTMPERVAGLVVHLGDGVDSTLRFL